MDQSISKEYYIHSKKLGEGGFGVVKLGTHLLTKQKVAIKIINKEKIKKDLFRINTEILALQQLRHKNIARLLQIINNEQHIYLVLEYCSGGELFDYLVSRSRLSEFEARKIIKALVKVLAFIHSKGFAHRDIKPENILLDEQHNIKLIDFGLCAYSGKASQGNLDHLSTCCGSPAYVAPELLKGFQYSGRSADIWSTGVLLFTLVTGRLPFENTNLAQLYESIKNGQFEIPKFLSNDIHDLITKMLQVDPNKRITSTEILNHRWIVANQTKCVLKETIADESELQLDTKILLKCSALFPNLDLHTLREKILNDNGYHSATYWLVKQKPELYKDFDESICRENINRRRSRSFSEFKSPPKMKRTNNLDSNNNNNLNDKLKTIKENCPKTEINNNKRQNKRVFCLDAKVNQKKCINKKLFSDNTPEKDLAKNRLLSQFNNLKSQAQISPIFPLPNSSNEKENKNFIDLKLDNFESIKVRSLNQQQTPNKCCQPAQNAVTNTPVTTPRKSVFKWLLETATPRKSSLPRRINTCDKNAKNYIITQLTNPDICLEKILQYFDKIGVNCKAKNYGIRCVLSTMNTIIVAFELEIVLCRNTGCVAIHHKRIRGTSWDYVKICDDIKNSLKINKIGFLNKEFTDVQ